MVQTNNGEKLHEYCKTHLESSTEEPETTAAKQLDVLSCNKYQYLVLDFPLSAVKQQESLSLQCHQIVRKDVLQILQ